MQFLALLVNCFEKKSVNIFVLKMFKFEFDGQMVKT